MSRLFVMSFWKKRILDPAQDHMLYFLHVPKEWLQCAYFCQNLTRSASYKSRVAVAAVGILSLEKSNGSIEESEYL